MSTEIPSPNIQCWLEESTAIDKYWDFGTLCQDLAKHKSVDLTEYETQLLKALLLSYGPKEIAAFLHSTDVAVRVAISQKVLPWIELLVSAALSRPITTTRERIPYWLERAGYRTAFIPLAIGQRHSEFVREGQPLIPSQLPSPPNSNSKTLTTSSKLIDP